MVKNSNARETNRSKEYAWITFGTSFMNNDRTVNEGHSK